MNSLSEERVKFTMCLIKFVLITLFLTSNVAYSQSLNEWIVDTQRLSDRCVTWIEHPHVITRKDDEQFVLREFIYTCSLLRAYSTSTSAVGIDRGISIMAACSDEREYLGAKAFRKHEKKLTKAQRSLSRKNRLPVHEKLLKISSG